MASPSCVTCGAEMLVRAGLPMDHGRVVTSEGAGKTFSRMGRPDRNIVRDFQESFTLHIRLLLYLLSVYSYKYDKKGYFQH